MVRAVEYIQSRFAAAITLEDFARASLASPYRLHRLFLRHVGLTPLEYQLSRRIQDVRDRLDAGAPLALAAVAAGFYDQSHCARYFKRIVGVTPRDYLRSRARD